MSRHHNTGEPPRKQLKEEQRRKILQDIYDRLYERDLKVISESTTVLTFGIQYMLDTLEDLRDKLHGENIDFTVKARNKAMAAIRDCEAFLEYFEPLIQPEGKEVWARDYDHYRATMDAWFNQDPQVYQMFSSCDRAKEVCRAAGLRYCDPYETNPRRCFELGFREGAAYADLHPIGSVVIKQGDKEEEVSLTKLVAAYAKTDNVTIELKGEKK